MKKQTSIRHRTRPENNGAASIALYYSRWLSLVLACSAIIMLLHNYKVAD